MTDEHILRTLRSQAWERAKGELQSMLHTFWGDMEGFKQLDTAVSEFIKQVEDNGLQE